MFLTFLTREVDGRVISEIYVECRMFVSPRYVLLTYIHGHLDKTASNLNHERFMNGCWQIYVFREVPVVFFDFSICFSSH